ncbi:MAG: hypothetical protein AAF489_07990 [Bacteroidota bacterium]
MESIFLSHHFDNEIAPVVESFKRLIESHDLEVIDGRRLEGQLVIDEVKSRIEEADAVIVFLSKREAGKTNEWVSHERSAAQTLGKPLLAVIEQGLTNAAPFGGFESLQYDPDKLADTLLDISESIFGWKLQLGEQIEALLEPEDIVTTVRENADRDGIVQYRLLGKRGKWGNWKKAVVIPRPGGVSLLLNGVTKKSELQIKVTTNNRIWNSDVVNRDLRILIS